MLRTATCEVFVVLIQRAGFLVVRADRLEVLLDQFVIIAMAGVFEERNLACLPDAVFLQEGLLRPRIYHFAVRAHEFDALNSLVFVQEDYLQVFAIFLLPLLLLGLMRHLLRSLILGQD